MMEDRQALDAYLDSLQAMEITGRLSPAHRLCLAVLRQAVVDYYSGSEYLRRDAAAYFAASPLYHFTLRLFRLPEDLLPVGIDRNTLMNEHKPTPLGDRAGAEELLDDLSGNELKLLLVMLGKSQPASRVELADAAGFSLTTTSRLLALLELRGFLARLGPAKDLRWSIRPERRAELAALFTRLRPAS